MYGNQRKDCADETSLDGRRSHTTHTCHHRRFTEKLRVGRGGPGLVLFYDISYFLNLSTFFFP